MDSLETKTAVVTGAASGIGLGMTEAFASRGMRVVMADIEAAVLDKEVERLTRANFQVTPCVTDVSSIGSVQDLMKTAIDHYGTVHVLCNNAGVSGGSGAIWETTERDWQWVMGVNLDGILNGLRAFIPHMLEHGEPSHIVNTSSIAGMMTGGGSPYGISKHAVSRLSEGLYFDLLARQASIGVTCLCPGIINTNIINSGRNRPEHLANAGTPGTLSPEQQKGMQGFIDYFKDQGMAPRQVGDLVAEAMLANQFYLFTQDEFMPLIKSRFDNIVDEKNPIQPDALPQNLSNDKGLQ